MSLRVGVAGLALRDRELHALPEWSEAVDVTRQKLGLRAGSPAERGPVLLTAGQEAVAAAIRSSFQALMLRTGLSDRYIAYFAACVVSHFRDGDAHVAPAWLRERLRRWRADEHPLPPGVVRLQFVHGVPAASRLTIHEIEAIINVQWTHSISISHGGLLFLPMGASSPPDNLSVADPVMLEITPHSPHPGRGLAITREPQARGTHDIRDFRSELQSSEWVDVPLPYGLELLWPYVVPMMCLSEPDILALRQQLQNAGVVTTWMLMDRLVVRRGERWAMLPMRVAENLPSGVLLNRLFGLPDNATVATMQMPVPLQVDGSGAVHLVEFDRSSPLGKARLRWIFRDLGTVQPFHPQLTADGTLPSDETAFAEGWRRLIQEATTLPALRGGPGAPPRRARTPGRVFSSAVEGEYRRLLREWGQKQLGLAQQRGESLASVPAPPTGVRKRRWESAKRSGREQVPRERRDRLPAHLRAAVEAEAPWEVVRPDGASPHG